MKDMKRRGLTQRTGIALAALLLVCCFLTACGGGGETAEAPAPAEETAEVIAEEIVEEIAEEPEEAPAEEPAGEPDEAPAESGAENDSPLVGSWLFYSQEGSAGQTITHEEVLAAREEQGYDQSGNEILTLRPDGTALASLFGMTVEYTWTDNGDGTGAITLVEELGPEALYLEDGLLVQDRGLFLVCFEPTEETADAVAAPETAPAADGASFTGSWQFYAQDGGGVDATVTHEDVLEMKAQGVDLSQSLVLTIHDDGTASVNFFGDLTEEVWTDSGDGTGTITLEGEESEMSLEDGLLVIRAAGEVFWFEPAA